MEILITATNINNFLEKLIRLLHLHKFLFELFEPNLIKLNLSELKFNQYNLKQFTALNYLVSIATMQQKQCKPTL
jgi:hypothetical protein